MRAVRAVAGLVAVLAARPAPGQPADATPSSGWRVDVSAALAFGYAEGKAAALARHAITTSPTTVQATDAALDKLDGLASAARDAYVFAAAHHSPFWAVAIDVRIGDTFACQAEKILAIPVPPQLAARLSGLPPSVAADYRMVLEGLVDPLRRQAIPYWERAAAAQAASRFWSGVARERLKGGGPPGC